MDARVHHVQAEAELVTANDLVATLTEFHRDRLTMRQRHVAVARFVSDYAFNNAYQNVISREDVHLNWLESALVELGVTPDSIGEPMIGTPSKKAPFLPFVQEDARDAAALVARWRPRLETVTNARHRNMMQVILGETLEHKRFFDQMLAGRADVLGRRSNGPERDGTGDGVLPVRWIE
jgi:hypothetical protein